MTKLWNPTCLAARPIPGGFALIDTSWDGDGEICRVMHTEQGPRPIPTAERWWFVSQIAILWNSNVKGYQ